ncbi:dihydrofolate reductase [Microvirga sp. W0021]|uniref:Dihydrofolate reductase n=1 Tax=Hohaiivirga grylli TaxID=3133970 RepID=A0ABV0BKW6_9HYPH
MTLPLFIVVAAADNGIIGSDNQLIWHIKSDLKHFKELTLGKPMIMGRKTYQSIGKPLPGRTTIVLTRDAGFADEVRPLGVETADSWEKAVILAQDAGRQMGADGIAIVGGAEIYALSLPDVQAIHLTEVHATPEGDTRFPEFDREQFSESYREEHKASDGDEYDFSFVGLVRNNFTKS